MKLIFLDFDGVLNSTQFFIMREEQWRNGTADLDELCSICISNLNHILDEIEDVQIVISSTWRVGKSTEQLQDILERNGFKYKERVIGCTPCHGYQDIRGEEIQEWLDKTNIDVDDFVILDDDEDMGKLMSHLFKTNAKHGLSLETAQQIITRFAGKSIYFDV